MSKRTVSRRSILAELALPARSGAKRLTASQIRTALGIDHDIQARWGTSAGVVPGAMTPRGGDRPLKQEPINFHARDRWARMQEALHPHERALLAAIEAQNLQPNGSLSQISIETGYAVGDQRSACLVGRIQALLDSAEQIYRPARTVDRGRNTDSTDNTRDRRQRSI